MLLRLGAAASLLALCSVLGASVALAADPPADVVLDGTVTVTFADPTVDDGTGIAGASVTLEARRPDLGADVVIQTLDGTTDPAGQAVFDGVARPADGAPPVELAVTASVSRVTVTNEGCLQADDLEGSATAEGAASVEIGVGVGSASSSIDCSPLVVTGTVLDPDGQPFVVATATATLTTPDGDRDVSATVAHDGTFRIDVPRWDPPTDATLELTVASAPTRTVDTGDGCGDTYALVAAHEWTLADPATVPDPSPSTRRRRSSGRCAGRPRRPAPRRPPIRRPRAPGGRRCRRPISPTRRRRPERRGLRGRSS